MALWCELIEMINLNSLCFIVSNMNIMIFWTGNIGVNKKKDGINLMVNILNGTNDRYYKSFDGVQKVFN